MRRRRGVRVAMHARWVDDFIMRFWLKRHEGARRRFRHEAGARRRARDGIGTLDFALTPPEAAMTDQVAALAQQGKALPAEERSRLVEILLESLHEGSLTDVEAAWDAEVERRLAAYDRGELVALDGEAVLAKARRLARG